MDKLNSMDRLNSIDYEHFQEVAKEYIDAKSKFPPMVSAHEGFAILKEEVDELWDCVKMKQYDPLRPEEMRKEVIQVAAMAIRFLNDVI